MTPFEDIIRQLGEKIGISLHVDAHQSCKLEFAGDIAVQIDLDGSADRLLIGAKLGNLIPGPYRENLFKQALIVNYLKNGQVGILAFSEKNDQLILFGYLLLTTTVDILFEYLKGFTAHALLWQEAIKRGEIPQIKEETKSSGIFGLR